MATKTPRRIGSTISRITKAEIITYWDNGQTIAYVSWVDTPGSHGTTEGDPANLHMRALLARAKREGVAIERKH